MPDTGQLNHLINKQFTDIFEKLTEQQIAINNRIL